MDKAVLDAVFACIENSSGAASVVLKNPTKEVCRLYGLSYYRGFFQKDSADILLWDGMIFHESTWRQLFDLGYPLKQDNIIRFIMSLDTRVVIIHAQKDSADILAERLKGLFGFCFAIEYSR